MGLELDVRVGLREETVLHLASGRLGNPGNVIVSVGSNPVKGVPSGPVSKTVSMIEKLKFGLAGWSTVAFSTTLNVKPNL